MPESLSLIHIWKESDIRGVAQELYRLGQRAARVEGTVYA